MSATAINPETQTDAHGSRTLTITNTNNTSPSSPETSDTPPPPVIGILSLTGASHPTTNTTSPRIQWDESVIDNEGMGKKSSKVCCIFHKARNWDESESDSLSSSEDECTHGGNKNKPNAYERQPKYKKKPRTKLDKKKKTPHEKDLPLPSPAP